MAASLRGLTPEMRAAWSLLLQQLRRHFGPIRYRLTSTVRSRAEQGALYRRQGAQGLAAPPGRSKHERGRAIDAVFEGFAENNIPGQFWKALGGRWGGDFRSNDWVHFEDPYTL